MTGRFAPAIRIKALDALAEAALTRDLKPNQNREKLIGLLQGAAPRKDAALEKSAVQLAGLWRLEAAADDAADDGPVGDDRGRACGPRRSRP